MQGTAVVSGHRWNVAIATRKLALAFGVVIGVAACKTGDIAGAHADTGAQSPDGDNSPVDSSVEAGSYDPCDCSNVGACPDPTDFEHSNCEYMPAILRQGVVSLVRYGDDCWAFEQESGDMFVAVFYRGKDKMDSSFVAKTWRNIPPAQGPLSNIGTGSGACGAPCGGAEVSREFVCGYHD